MLQRSHRACTVSGQAGTETRRPGLYAEPTHRGWGCPSAHILLWVYFVAAGAVVLASSGCTGFKEYLDNGFKVGPNYRKPDAPVAQHWIDEAEIRVHEGESLAKWWTVFNDDRLNYLIHCSYSQNIHLKDFAFQVLAARAQLAIAKGELFPQTQNLTGSYAREAVSGNPPPFNTTVNPPQYIWNSQTHAWDPNPAWAAGPQTVSILPAFTSIWTYNFNLQWEIDFWGRLRRAITSAADNVDVSVENYDAVLVTLLHDVATNYTNVRTYQERIALLKTNAEVQRGVLAYIENRYKAGFKQSELDLDQAVSNLRQTESGIPLLEIQVRQFEDALCTLLGMPPKNLDEILGSGPIPTTPPEVAIGIPADLLRRRPDVRAAERTAAAQAEQIGIAQAQLYPIFTLNGTVGYEAQEFSALFSQAAFQGAIGPSFQWNILNYGRIINNVRYQDATFQHLVAAYQQSVLAAAQQVEDGLALFLKSQQETKLLDESVVAALKAVKIVILQYQVGAVDFNRYATIEQAAVTQQDSAATARGNIALGLINVYTAMGGGWEIRLSNEAAPALPPVAPATKTPGGKTLPEEVPVPQTDVPKPKEIPAAPATGAAKPKKIPAALPQDPLNAKEIPPMPPKDPPKAKEISPVLPKDLPKAKEILPAPPQELPKPHEDVTAPMDDAASSSDKASQTPPNSPAAKKTAPPQ